MDALVPSLAVVHNKRAIAPNWHRARGAATPSLGGNLLLTSESEEEEDDARARGETLEPSSRFRGPLTPLFGGKGEVADLRARHRDAQPLTPTATAMAVVTAPPRVSNGASSSEDDSATVPTRRFDRRTRRSASGPSSPAMLSSRRRGDTFVPFSRTDNDPSEWNPGVSKSEAGEVESSPGADALGALTSGSEPPSPIKKLEGDGPEGERPRASTRRDRAKAKRKQRRPEVTRSDTSKRSDASTRSDTSTRSGALENVSVPRGETNAESRPTEEDARVADFDEISTDASDTDADASSDASETSLASASSVSFALEGDAAEAFACAIEEKAGREAREEKAAAEAETSARGRVGLGAGRGGTAPPPKSGALKPPPPPPPPPPPSPSASSMSSSFSSSSSPLTQSTAAAPTPVHVRRT